MKQIFSTVKGSSEMIERKKQLRISSSNDYKAEDVSFVDLGQNAKAMLDKERDSIDALESFAERKQKIERN